MLTAGKRNRAEKESKTGLGIILNWLLEIIFSLWNYCK